MTPSSQEQRSLVQLLAASVRATDHGELERLARTADWRVRATVAANESTSLDTLAALESDPDERVLLALQRNSHVRRLLVEAQGTQTPQHRLAQLALSTLRMVSTAAVQSLRDAETAIAAATGPAAASASAGSASAEAGDGPTVPEVRLGERVLRLIERKRRDNPEILREVAPRTVRRAGGDRAVSAEMLTAHYGGQDGRVRCQICREISTFRRNNGRWYFEVVELMKLGHEDDDNRVALCPTCSAKFQYARPADADRALKHALSAVDMGPGTDEVRVPVQLAGERNTIHFTFRHYEGVLAALHAHGNPSPDKSL